MQRRVRRAARWSVALAFIGLVALVSALPASANHAWGNYHWARTANPFTIKLGNNLSGEWPTYLSATSSDWSQSAVLDTTIDAGQSNKRCAPTTGRVEVCNGRYGRNGWLGLASIWLTSGDHIVQGTVKVNDTYFSMPQYNTPDEKRHVMCQEVGHTFGLGHTSEDGSSQGTCMDYSTSPDSTRPNQHDYDQLASIYAHLDNTTTVGATTSALPAAASNADLDTPAQWGRLVHASGRTAIYEREFPGGHKAVTFVIWADADHGLGR